VQLQKRGPFIGRKIPQPYLPFTPVTIVKGHVVFSSIGKSYKKNHKIGSNKYDVRVSKDTKGRNDIQVDYVKPKDDAFIPDGVLDKVLEEGGDLDLEIRRYAVRNARKAVRRQLEISKRDSKMEKR